VAKTVLGHFMVRVNKKLHYHEEHSASVMLIGVLNDIYRETVNIINS